MSCSCPTHIHAPSSDPVSTIYAQCFAIYDFSRDCNLFQELQLIDRSPRGHTKVGGSLTQWRGVSTVAKLAVEACRRLDTLHELTVTRDLIFWMTCNTPLKHYTAILFVVFVGIEVDNVCLVVITAILTNPRRSCCGKLGIWSLLHAWRTSRAPGHLCCSHPSPAVHTTHVITWLTLSVGIL